MCYLSCIMMLIRANAGALRLYDILLSSLAGLSSTKLNSSDVYPLKVKPDDVGGRFRSNAAYPTPFSSPSDELSTLLLVDQTAILFAILGWLLLSIFSKSSSIPALETRNIEIWANVKKCWIEDRVFINFLSHFKNDTCLTFFQDAPFIFKKLFHQPSELHFALRQ